MTKIGHVAYQSMLTDESYTMKQCPMLYLFSIKSYWQKNMHSFKWPLMTFQEAIGKNAPWSSRVFHEDVNILMSWSVPMCTHGSRGISIFLHWLIMERLLHGPDLRSQIWKIQLETSQLEVLMPSCNPPSLKLLWQTLQAGNDCKLVLRQGQLTWPGDLTWSAMR